MIYAKRFWLILLACFACTWSVWGQRGAKKEQWYTPLGQYIEFHPSFSNLSTARVEVKSASVGGSTVILNLNANGLNIPYREEMVEDIYAYANSLLPMDMQGYKVVIRVEGQNIEDLIPEIYKGKTFRSSRQKWGERAVKKTQYPLVKKLGMPYAVTSGLQGRHIALWQSHGRYFDTQKNEWKWQRPLVFGTTEDLFTQSYIVPYVVPMLENAGAVVLLPRERDMNKEEYIIDNDASRLNRGVYTERNAKVKWQEGAESGFAYTSSRLRDNENPFTHGSYRQIESRTKGELSRATWIPEIKKEGEYAVYVSYKSLPNSVEDAHYSVYHAGGVSTYVVNQTMGGGTWIYLGTFRFKPEKEGVPQNFVTLTNESATSGKVITADAVKIGGGMGHVERGYPQVVGRGRRKRTIPATYSISGMPRYAEGARYWMQWAGVPDSIYNGSKSANDYVDDYRSRGQWVNYLMGGLPTTSYSGGLNIPIDLSFALHSDAGMRDGEETFGVLGIYNSKQEDGRYYNGISRTAARDLTDIVQTTIMEDLRRIYRKDWVRRGMWDRNYSEATWQHVPSLLLEMISHQNRADMQYGLDPDFRFNYSRAIYKGILKFLSHEFGQKYVVQPLPPNKIAVEPWGQDSVVLTWSPQLDPLEPSATPHHYMVYTRKNDGGFDNGLIVADSMIFLPVEKNNIYSFKVTGVNDGGESFPSEVVSAGVSIQTHSEVLVVNGFDRVSAPSLFGEYDPGMPYIKDISAVEHVAGNSFDYPYTHGKALMASGCSFYSSSVARVEKEPEMLKRYTVVDLVLGKQRSTVVGTPSYGKMKYKSMSSDLQFAVESYLMNGGRLILTGAHLVSDLSTPLHSLPNTYDRKFLNGVLNLASPDSVQTVPVEGQMMIRDLTNPKEAANYYNVRVHSYPNPDHYYINSVDALWPNSQENVRMFIATNEGVPLGLSLKSPYRIVVSSIPFETIYSEEDRAWVMNIFLRVLRE
ncbi:MAG: xanthan lyase [Porphyromonas sp.]|nr:xanthan lyase [Porphyromonas sp.]